MTEELLSSLLEDMTNEQAFNHIEKYKGLKVRLQAEAIHEEWQKEERL
jgi:hypothetical protein